MITPERLVELQAIANEIGDHPSWPGTPEEDFTVLVQLAVSQLLAGADMMKPPVYTRDEFITALGQCIACIYVPAVMQMTGQVNNAVFAKATERFLRAVNAFGTRRMTEQ